MTQLNPAGQKLLIQFLRRVWIRVCMSSITSGCKLVMRILKLDTKLLSRRDIPLKFHKIHSRTKQMTSWSICPNLKWFGPICPTRTLILALDHHSHHTYVPNDHSSQTGWFGVGQFV